jgi:hypothetical protein
MKKMKNEKQLFEIPSLTSLEGKNISLNNHDDLNTVYASCSCGCELGCSFGDED